jgi:hypothetical protein
MVTQLLKEKGFAAQIPKHLFVVWMLTSRLFHMFPPQH